MNMEFQKVENTVEKGEIARYEQFLLFPEFFLKRFVPQTRKNQGLLGKGLNDLCPSKANNLIEEQLSSAFVIIKFA